MPFLYSTIRLDSSTPLQTLEDLNRSKWVRYTKRFHNVIAKEAAQETVGKLLLGMPLLSHLQYVGQTIDVFGTFILQRRCS